MTEPGSADPDEIVNDAARTNTYLNAISDLSEDVPAGHWVKLSTRLAIANACMAVADQELAESEAQWQRESDARDQDFADFSATIERVKALAEKWRDESRGSQGDLSVRTRRNAYALFAAIDAHESGDGWAL